MHVEGHIGGLRHLGTQESESILGKSAQVVTRLHLVIRQDDVQGHLRVDSRCRIGFESDGAPEG